MANLPSDFWSGWIIVLFTLGFVWLLWLVLGVYFQKDTGQHDTEHEAVWDGNLREGSSPAPMWWFWLILAAMVFSVMYLMLYPGMGSFAGAFRWSQGGQYAENHALYELEFAERRNQLLALPLAEVAQDPVAMDAAQRLFIDNCAACHGRDGRGQLSMFPNLRDTDWQWGSEPMQIEQTIRNGRRAVMIGWQAALGEEGVANVADYVVGMADGVAEEHPGRQQFQTFCSACHGMDGMGNVLLGAPRLNDDVWLYGGDREAILHSITVGRSGQMPAFGATLDELQIRLLVAWLLR